jgi:AmiR/NasT family two-component response regulator
VVDRLATTAAGLRRYADRLQELLDETVVVEQAKGVLSERLRVPLAEASLILERTASERGVAPATAAREIVDGRHR